MSATVPDTKVEVGRPAVEPHDGTNQFRREGEYWTICYGGSTIRLRDCRGLQYLADLLRHSGQAVPAINLVASALPLLPEITDTHPAIIPRAQIERARVNATRAIKEALKKIAAYHAPLAAHLRTTIRTGTSCSYLPDARVPIVWQL